jgi:hypothetical protein
MVLERVGFTQYRHPGRQVVGQPAVVHRFTKPRRWRLVGAVMGPLGCGPPTAYSVAEGSAGTLHGPYPSVLGNRSTGLCVSFPEHADGHAVALRHDHATRQATLGTGPPPAVYKTPEAAGDAGIRRAMAYLDGR